MIHAAVSASAVFALLLASQPQPVPDPRCPAGSTSPEAFADWYRRALGYNAELYAAEHGRPPGEGELLPLLPEQIELNLEILCNCLPRLGERERPPPDAGSCVPDAATLCLDGRWLGDGRFEVRVAFQAVPAAAPCDEGQVRTLADRRLRREGLFWCSEPEDPELMFKLVDGCAVNGYYWVVWSAARGVELTATVTDTRTDQETVYVVRSAAPETDLEALPCEPADGPVSER